MNVIIEQVFEQVRGAARFRWIAMGTAWLICLVGWAGVMFMPDRYSAQARIYVDIRTSLDPVLQGLAINQDVSAQLTLVRQSLLGRPQLEKVAREADIDIKATTPEARARMLDMLRERVAIDARDFGGGGTVYSIGYESPSRETSLKVVDILLNTFIEDTLGGKRTGVETAQSFLKSQIQEYEQRLREAEQRLADFKRINVGQMPGAQGDYFTRLQKEINEVDKVKADLSIAITRREELQRQLRGERPAGGLAATTPPEAASEVLDRLKEARAKLDELLLRFTDRHPDVVALRETIRQLEDRRATELDSFRKGDFAALAGTGATSNPVFQSIQLGLNEAEVQIAALRGELNDRERNVAELRKLVDTVPEVEAEFARLNRDYDVTRSQYNALVERLQKANLGEQAQAAESIRFEVIDPPNAAFKAIAPNRPLLLATVLIVALGSGAGLAYLLHLLRPVFNSSRVLNEITGLPVLGVVSMTWLNRRKSRIGREYVALGCGIAVLIACFGLVLRYNDVGVQLAQRLVG